MVRRRLREPGMIDRIAGLVVFQKGLKLSDDEFERMCKTEEIQKRAIYNLNVVDLKDRLYEKYNGRRTLEQCHKEAITLLTTIPEELTLNVEEWLDNKPLSDVKIHGISINDIFEICGGINNVDFIQILKCFAAWKKGNYIDPNFCSRYFSIM